MVLLWCHEKDARLAGKNCRFNLDCLPTLSVWMCANVWPPLTPDDLKEDLTRCAFFFFHIEAFDLWTLFEEGFLAFARMSSSGEGV